MPSEPTVESSIFDRLTADDGFTAAAGDRLFPNSIPELEPQTPWVYYTITASEPIEDLQGNIKWVAHTVEFTILGDTYESVQDVGNAIRTSLHAWQGGQVRRARWTGESTQEYEDGYSRDISFRVEGVFAPVTYTSSGLPRLEVRSDGVYWNGEKLGAGGSNEVTDETPTDLVGYLKGDGQTVSATDTVPYSDLSGVPARLNQLVGLSATPGGFVWFTPAPQSGVQLGLVYGGGLGFFLFGTDTPEDARELLELGDAATLDVGTTASTLAAGDHTHAGYAAASHTHAYSTLTGLPTLGTAAALNVGTTAGTVAAGDHTHTTFSTITVSGLTAGRVVYAGTGGLLTGDAGFTYSSGNLDLANDRTVRAKDTGGTPRRLFFLDPANNYGCRNEAPSGDCYYGVGNPSNTSGTIIFQLHGDNLAGFDSAGNFTATNYTTARAATLASLTAATGTNTLYYRSGANTRSPVTLGPGLTFSGGVLDVA